MRPAEQHARGFSLVELLLALMVVAILCALAYPSFRAQWFKARRGDARLALMQLQQAQERWRAEHPRYASADDLKAPLLSPHGHYRLAVRAPTATGFELHAEAQGAQRGDAPCAVFLVRQQAGDTTLLSGITVDTPNADDVNRGCWNR